MAYRRTERETARLAARYEAIIAAARALASESGLGAVQVVPVAERAGIAAGTVYRYFPSKDDLVAAVVNATAEREVAAIRAAAAAAPGALSGLAAAIVAFAAGTMRMRRLAFAMLAEAPPPYPPAQAGEGKSIYPPPLAGEGREGAASALTGGLNRAVEYAVDAYQASLEWVLRHERATLVVTIATLIATIWLYVIVPKGFLPIQDTVLIKAVTEAGPEVSYAEMQRLQHDIVDMIRRDVDVTGVISVAGVTPMNPTPNAGRLAITLKPRDQRPSF